MARGGSRPGAGRKPGSQNTVTADVKALAAACGNDAIKVLHTIAMSAEFPAASRVSAANALLDRGYGKPETTANVNVKRDVRDMTTDEILTALAAFGVAGEKEVDSGHPPVH